MMDYPNFNLYAKPIKKIKEAELIDNNMSKELEKPYLDGSLKQVGTIDTENFPQNIPDSETCKILDDLFSHNQLQSKKQVRYCVILQNSPVYMSDYFEEYTYNGRKFIRQKASVNQPENITLSNNDGINKDTFYWVEVKPLSENSISYTEFDSSMSGKKR